MINENMPDIWGKIDVANIPDDHRYRLVRTRYRSIELGYGFFDDRQNLEKAKMQGWKEVPARRHPELKHWHKRGIIRTESFVLCQISKDLEPNGEDERKRANAFIEKMFRIEKPATSKDWWESPLFLLDAAKAYREGEKPFNDLMEYFGLLEDEEFEFQDESKLVISELKRRGYIE